MRFKLARNQEVTPNDIREIAKEQDFELIKILHKENRLLPWDLCRIVASSSRNSEDIINFLKYLSFHKFYIHDGTIPAAASNIKVVNYLQEKLKSDIKNEYKCICEKYVNKYCTNCGTETKPLYDLEIF